MGFLQTSGIEKLSSVGVRENANEIVLYRSGHHITQDAIPEQWDGYIVKLVDDGGAPKPAVTNSTIGPWIPHPEYGGAGTEVRKNIKTGEIIVTLFPEGLEESQCWVWEIGNMHGHKDDREDARRQADEILMRLA